MDAHPWSADRALDTRQVRSAIRSQFEDIPVAGMTWLGSGWDNDVFLVDDAWIFRFPRRRDVAERLDREMAAASLAREALADLAVQVPRIDRIGHPSKSFPYRFVGYRKVPGRPAPDLPDLAVSAPLLGSQIGRILSRLHRIPPERAADSGLKADEEGAREWHAEASHIAEDLLAREGQWIRSCLEWLEGDPRLPSRYEGPARFLHNDLCPDHVLMDSEGRVSGLLDFGDAALGDPALDFFILPAWLGPAGTESALASYEIERDSNLEARIVFLARVTSLTWLHDAHLRAADVAKHREWVRRAFTEVR